MTIQEIKRRHKEMRQLEAEARASMFTLNNLVPTLRCANGAHATSEGLYVPLELAQRIIDRLQASEVASA